MAMKSIYLKTEASFKTHMVIFWANLARLNNLLIILNVTLFFLTGLVAQGYTYTFISIGCFGVVAILMIIPVPFVNRLWFYLLNLTIELIGIYFLVASVIYWVRTGAPVGV